MKLFKRMLHKRISLVIVTVGVSIFSIVISLWWNHKISLIINMVTNNIVISNITIITSIVTILLSSGVAYLLGLLSGWTCETLAHDLRMGNGKHFITKPSIEMANINAGEYLSKLQNEIADISGYLRNNLFSIVDDCIRFIITFTWMLCITPKLTILVHIPNIFILWYTIYTSKVIGNMVQESGEANAKMCSHIDTLIHVFPILRIYNSSPLVCSKYSKVINQWKTLNIKEERIRAKLMSLSGLLSCIPLILLFLIGGTQVIKGELPLGTLYIYINLSGNVSGVMMNMPGRIALLRGFIANIKRIHTSVLIKER